MELPKNITQIGMPDRMHKIYMEDYVVSYMKQQRKEQKDRKRILLFGYSSREEETEYYFVYGACILEGIYRGEDYLTDSEKEEAAAMGQRFFGQYWLIGWMVMDEELPEGMFLYQGGKAYYISGYSCFYEKNDCMLNFMVYKQEEAKQQLEREEELDEKEQGSSIGTVQAEAVRMTGRQRMLEENLKRTHQEKKKMDRLGVAVAAMLLVLSVIGIQNSDKQQGMAALQKTAEYIMARLGDKQLPDRQEAVAPVQSEQMTHQSPIEPMQAVEQETDRQTPEIVVEDVMAEAIQQENAAASLQDNMASTLPDEQPVSYVIQKGDTLLGISERQYGSRNRVQEICTLNQIDNPDNIKIGQKIFLP